MGRSTVNQLIQRAKNMNEYNNSGVASDVVWLDFFNEALTSMVDDLGIEESYSITCDPAVTSYDLPEDYYQVLSIVDSANNELSTFKDFGFNIDGGRSYNVGYLVKNKGAQQAIELKHIQPESMTVHYIRYPETLLLADVTTQKPEVPTVGETALCYKAVSHALKNNNQLGQAQYFEELYAAEVSKVNKATTRARGQ